MVRDDTWEVIGSNKAFSDDQALMKGSCRNKPIAKVLKLDAMQSKFLIEFQDGTTAWVDIDELDKAAKAYFQILKPSKKKISNTWIKIEHISTGAISKVSTFGIQNVEELKNRYMVTTGCHHSSQLYIKDDISEQLVFLSPTSTLPINSSRIYAETIPSNKSSVKGPNSITSSKVSSEIRAYMDPTTISIPPVLQSLLELPKNRDMDMENMTKLGRDEVLHKNHSMGNPLTAILIEEKQKEFPYDNKSVKIFSGLPARQRDSLSRSILNGTLTYKELQEAMDCACARVARSSYVDTSMEPTMELITPRSSKSSVTQKQTLCNTLTSLPMNTSPQNLDTVQGIIKQSTHKADLTPLHYKRNTMIEPSVFENHSGDTNEWVFRVVSAVSQKLRDIAHQHRKELTEQDSRNREIVEKLRARIGRIGNVKCELNEIIRKDKTEIMSSIKIRMNKMDRAFEIGYEKFITERAVLKESICKKMMQVDRQDQSQQGGPFSDICRNFGTIVRDSSCCEKRGCVSSLGINCVGSSKSDPVKWKNALPLSHGKSIDLDLLCGALDEKKNQKHSKIIDEFQCSNTEESKEDFGEICNNLEESQQGRKLDALDLRYYLDITTSVKYKQVAIGEQFEMTLNIKNKGIHSCKCFATLNPKGDSSRLQWDFLEESRSCHRKKIIIDVNPGDIVVLHVLFTVPSGFTEGEYSFWWQLVECGTGANVGPPFVLNQTLCLPLETEKQKKLKSLYEIGFTDRVKVIKTLRDCEWDLNQTVNKLLRE